MITKKLRQLHGKIDRWIQSLKWHRDCKKIRICIDSKNEILTSPGKRILVISPHADDELIGAYCIISRFNQKCEMFYCGLLGDDAENQIIKETRCAEYIKFCESMSVPYHIPAEQDSWIKRVSKIINQISPDVVIMPSFLDWHWEHRNVCEWLLEHLESIKYAGVIYMYQVSVPLPESWITDYCLMNKRQSDTKWQKFSEIYTSQSYMPIQRFRAAERVYLLNGTRIIAEPYRKISAGEINENIRLFKNFNIQSLNDLRYRINNLKQVRDECEKMVQNR